MDINPFTNEFVRAEIKFMELDTKNDIEFKGIRIVHKKLSMRLDDYLNKQWHIGDLTVPVFFIDGKLWMSLTPMEIQSNYLAWKTASGCIGMGGLGIGYTALRAAHEDDVEEVVVFEREKRAIDLFSTRYAHRPEFKKIKFIVGDARETFKGYHFDMVYMDIYAALCSDEMLSDFKLFTENNFISEYHFWSEEKIILTGISENIITNNKLTYMQQVYFKHWQNTESANMYEPLYDTQYVKEALHVIEDYRYG